MKEKTVEWMAELAMWAGVLLGSLSIPIVLGIVLLVMVAHQATPQ